MNPLERYAPLVEDHEAFFAACEQPLPSVVRVNSINATPERAKRALDEEGVGYEEVGWNSQLLRLDERGPGTSWPYFHGWLHGQEEVSALPAIALDPQRGEKVWDSCAAPGSKTTQLSAMMDDTGIVVGNDNNLGRLSALRHNAERLGVTNLAVTRQDGRNFSLKPFGFEEFDRAIVDAPCSCEGTIRKNPDTLDQWTLEHVHSVAAIQKGILSRAIQATKPGGTVVYSTCTFAPEENEAVVDHVLETEECDVVDFECPLESRPGVTEWEDDTYDDRVENTHRIYPHLNDTGGFYCAKLEVTA